MLKRPKAGGDNTNVDNINDAEITSSLIISTRFRSQEPLIISTIKTSQRHLHTGWGGL